MNSTGTDDPSRASAASDTGPDSTRERQPEIPLSKRTRAARMLEQLISTEQVTPSDLARALVVSDLTLAAYRTGRAKIPLERQLCLALFAIEHSAVARRAGFALRAQVEAEMAVASTRSETHKEPPVIHRWP